MCVRARARTNRNWDCLMKKIYRVYLSFDILSNLNEACRDSFKIRRKWGMKKSECFSVHSLEETLRSSTLFEATGEIFRAVILFPRWDISRIWYATDKYSTMQRCLCDAIHEKFRDNCLYIHEIFLDPISNNATKYSAVRYCFYILRYNIPSNVTKYSAARYCLCIVTTRNISYMMNEIFCDTILSSNVTKYSVTLFVYYHERNTSRYDIASNTTDEIFHIYDVTNISRYNIASNDTKCSTVQYCLYITTGEIFHVQRHERNISRCDIASNGWDIPPYNATKYSAYCLYITTHEIFRGIKYCLYITTDEIFRTRRYGRNIPR